MMWEKIFFKDHDFKPWENNSPNNSIYDHFPSATPTGKNNNRNASYSQDSSSEARNEFKRADSKAANNRKNRQQIVPTKKKNSPQNKEDDASSSSEPNSDDSPSSQNRSSPRSGSGGRKKVGVHAPASHLSNRSKSGSRSPPQQRGAGARGEQPKPNLLPGGRAEGRNIAKTGGRVPSPEAFKPKGDQQIVPKMTQAQRPPSRPQSSQAKMLTKLQSEGKEPNGTHGGNNNDGLPPNFAYASRNSSERPQSSPRKFVASSPPSRQSRVGDNENKGTPNQVQVTKGSPSKFIPYRAELENMELEERGLEAINRIRRESSAHEILMKNNTAYSQFYFQPEEKPINMNKTLQESNHGPRVVLVDKKKKFVSSNQIMNAQIKIKNVTFQNFFIKMENNQTPTTSSNLSNSALSFNGYKRTKVKFLNKSGATGGATPEQRPMSANVTKKSGGPLGAGNMDLKKIDNYQPLIRNFMKFNANEASNLKHMRRKSKSSNNISIKIVQYPMITQFNKL